MRHLLLAGPIAVAALLAIPAAGQAQVIQGTVDGAQNGAAQGSNAAGPIGGIVGGAIGAGVGAATGAVGTATGIVGSVLGTDDRPRFHDYVAGENYPSYRYRHPLRVGTILPRAGVTYYEVPADYPSARQYRYARINDRTVLVDPRTRRVVDIVD